jgi:hypothetical protein
VGGLRGGVNGWCGLNEQRVCERGGTSKKLKWLNVTDALGYTLLMPHTHMMQEYRYTVFSVEL